jgi:hypothetical protein
MNIGDSLTFTGSLTKLERREKYGVAEAEVNLTNHEGRVVVPGRASVVLQYRNRAAVPYPFVP